MKKLGIIFVIFFVMIGVCGCDKKKKENIVVSDALKFKEEYEKLNGTVSSSGKTIRTISIDKDNPMIYKSEDDIVNMIHRKETFVVYFGFAACPWCRSVLPNLLKVSSDLGIKSIYYVDVLDIRNVMKLDDNHQVVTEKEGTDGYYELVKLFDSVLEEYTLKNEQGESVSCGMKRIYAPNIIAVVDGKVSGFTTGISEKQTDGYMLLTDEMNKESYDMIKCSIRCVSDAKNTCSPKGMC